jgi:hypothetical protein
MATILDKDLTRESTVKFDDREIQVTLTADQKITFKLKGMKSGMLSISIEDLYLHLAGEPNESKSKAAPVKKKDTGDDPMISLHRLRHMTLVTKMDRPVKLELEKVLCEMLNDESITLDGK